MEHRSVRAAKIESDPGRSLAALMISNALADRDHDAAIDLIRTEADCDGMSALARKAQLDRVNLYRMLGPQGNPKLSVMIRILDALGYRLQVAPRE